MAFIRLEELLAARTRALRAVLHPDSGYFWRKLTRWACQSLNISIFDAEALPVNVLLRHYYECTFEEMDEEQRTTVLKKITETVEEVAAREQEKQVEEEQIDEFEAMVRAEAEAAAKKSGYQVLSKDEASKLKEQSRDTARTPSPPKVESVPDLTTLPPDVTINFVDEDKLDDEVGWDLFAPKQSKK